MDESLQREPEINKFFHWARIHEASDLYLHVGSPLQLRLRGVVRCLDMRPITQEDMDRLVSPILYDEQRHCLSEGKEVTFVYAIEEDDAYRVEVSSKDGGLSLSARRLKR